MNDVVRRVVVVVVIVGAVVAAGVTDRVVARGAPVSGPTASLAAIATAAVGASVAVPGVESSAGYCPASTAGTTGYGSMTVLLTNSTAKVVTGTITAVSSGGSSATIAVSVPASGQVGINPPPTTSGDFAAVTVLLNGGGVAVSEQVAGPLGYSTAPCASAPGTQWYFAHGSTASGDLLDLMLFNPGAAPAVVDVALATSSSGYIQPPAYQGVEVPPGALVVENVSDHAINDPSVSTTVTALSGSVVAGSLEQLGSSGQGGLSVLLGAPSPERTWSFPYNVDEGGETVAFNVFNPTTTAAAVNMEINLQQGSAEPLKIRVPALSTVAVLAENQTRIPAGSVYGAEFVTTKGPGIVVERQLSVSTPTVPGAEQGDTAGVAVGGPSWLVPTLPSDAYGISDLVVENMSSKRIHVSVSAVVGGRLRAVDHYSEVSLNHGAVLVISPGPTVALGTDEFEIEATGAAAVEVDPLPVSAPGVATLAVLPLQKSAP